MPLPRENRPLSFTCFTPAFGVYRDAAASHCRVLLVRSTGTRGSFRFSTSTSALSELNDLSFIVKYFLLESKFSVFGSKGRVPPPKWTTVERISLDQEAAAVRLQQQQRLPAMSGDISVPRKPRTRTRFGLEQSALLENLFHYTQYPSLKQVESLRANCGIHSDEKAAITWFQNKRATFQRTLHRQPITSTTRSSLPSLPPARRDRTVHSLDYVAPREDLRFAHLRSARRFPSLDYVATREESRHASLRSRKSPSSDYVAFRTESQRASPNDLQQALYQGYFTPSTNKLWCHIPPPSSSSSQNESSSLARRILAWVSEAEKTTVSQELQVFPHQDGLLCDRETLTIRTSLHMGSNKKRVGRRVPYVLVPPRLPTLDISDVDIPTIPVHKKKRTILDVEPASSHEGRSPTDSAQANRMTTRSVAKRSRLEAPGYVAARNRSTKSSRQLAVTSPATRTTSRTSSRASSRKVTPRTPTASHSSGHTALDQGPSAAEHKLQLQNAKLKGKLEGIELMLSQSARRTSRYD
ncbi:hypothetical protein BDN72DRAFT_857915 [Pluteus cervinus]|uniref:Uncharacterized protein n=1 Tax=Pluteus cervinus TaxID=181527 RepID=A0ACD3ATV1_9AGAR|nr:hypothetical protein BDN72DRAFT_857915 [Pluteus cervinus]